MNLVRHPNVFHCCSNCQIWWTWARQPQIHAWSMKFRKKLKKNKLEFIWNIFTSRSQWNKSHSTQINISWDLIENVFFTIKMKKLVSCSSMNWEKFVKTSFMRKSLSKSHFSKLLQVLLTLKNLLESKIFVGKQNPWIQFQSSHFSQNRSNFHSNTSSLYLQSSIA